MFSEINHNKMNQPTIKDADTMFYWINNVMEFEKYYTVKSKLAENTVRYLIESNEVNNIEFNHDYSKIRKIDLTGYKPANKKKSNN